MSNLEVSIYCPHCRRYTSLQIARTNYQHHNSSVHVAAVWEEGQVSKWWIGICNSCLEPVLVRNQGELVYPSSLPSPSNQNIPDHIRTDLDEAKLCYGVSAFRACAVMARRAIQVAAKDKNAPKGTLVDQINWLESSGTITKDLKEWATVVRWVGNDAAHPNKDPVAKDDAEAVLSLAEQFLNVIYVTPALALATRQKRGK